MRIQWYPGHMAKAKRMMERQLALVDVVFELLDARIPYSSRNPDIDALIGEKKRVIILNKADLAAPAETRKWEAYFRGRGFFALAVDARQKNIKIAETARILMKEKIERQRARGRIDAPIRAMVAGIPNVGKSTLINQLTGRSATLTGDRPGVTRGRQWLNAGGGLELLDTPGVLWPKFEDETAGVKLAVTGAVSDVLTDSVTLCEQLIIMLGEIAPESYIKRYKLSGAENKNPRELLEMAGAARGFKIKGGSVDIERAAVIILDEFRAGKLGRLTLDKAPHINHAAPPRS